MYNRGYDRAPSSVEDLGLDRLYVVYPGDERFDLSQRIEALGLYGQIR
jgi:hypothetical protein